MPVINRIAEFHNTMTAWRRDFHAHPELGLEEQRTAAIVAEALRSFGVDEVVTGIAQTGVVGVIRGGSKTAARAIGLRADMDALPIVEQTNVPYASTTPGVMHACGHDGHTAMLLGAARYLAETRRFDGTVYLIFQPAEEGIGGGRMMVEEGLFERFPMQHVFGLHNWPSIPAGIFAWRNGPTMAAVDMIEINLTGKGAHGAYPHDGIDPIVVAAAIIQNLQSIVARVVDPVHPAVVTIGHIAAGSTHNVIPETARMLGTARWFDAATGDALRDNVIRMTTDIAHAYGARVEIEYQRAFPATINDPKAMALGKAAAEAVSGAARVQAMLHPTMGGEDFSFMLNVKSGSYIMLGAGRGSSDPLPHHPKYDFNDDILPIGASYWATLAERLLACDTSL